MNKEDTVNLLREVVDCELEKYQYPEEVNDLLLAEILNDVVKSFTHKLYGGCSECR